LSTVKVSVDEALPLAGTVTGLGKLMVTPVGKIHSKRQRGSLWK